jgi:hypothetical protein
MMSSRSESDEGEAASRRWAVCSEAWVVIVSPAPTGGRGLGDHASRRPKSPPKQRVGCGFVRFRGGRAAPVAAAPRDGA